MQNKIDQLTNILNSLRSEKQKSYAIKLLSEIIDVFNGQSNSITKLIERKFNIKPGEGDYELDKYIKILLIYGFSQEKIAFLEQEILNFILSHSNQLIKKPTYNDLQKIQTFYRMHYFEHERYPDDLNELKQFIINATEN